MDKRREGHHICIAVANLKPGDGAVVRVCVGWKATAHGHMFAARDEMAVLHHKSLPGSEAEQESRATSEVGGFGGCNLKVCKRRLVALFPRLAS